MARDGSGTYAKPAGTELVTGTTAKATDVESRFAEIEADLNVNRPVEAGGTAASSASGARTNLDVAGKSATETISGNWTFSNPVAVAAATAGGEALNRTTADGRYPQKAGTETISGTFTFSNPVPVAAATAGGHALNRDTADGRYPRNTHAKSTSAGKPTFAVPSGTVFMRFFGAFDMQTGDNFSVDASTDGGSTYTPVLKSNEIVSLGTVTVVANVVAFTVGSATGAHSSMTVLKGSSPTDYSSNDATSSDATTWTHVRLSVNGSDFDAYDVVMQSGGA